MRELDKTLDFLRHNGIENPQTAIVLGTGLGKLVDEIVIEKTLDYAGIPNFPVSTVESHKGMLIYGNLEGRKILAMQGRFHFYEGYSLREVTFPVRVMKELGARELILSNAAGAMNRQFKKGSLMLIDDHINFLPDNPLRGYYDPDSGPRFPDMSCPYSGYLNELILEVAREEKIVLHKGVYVAVMGPSLETRAEYRMFGQFADAVGMSTVPEVIVANQIGLPCAAVSVLTDECDPDNIQVAELKDILATAAIAEKDLILVIKGLIRKLKQD